jgi:hypothetical protein
MKKEKCEVKEINALMVKQLKRKIILTLLMMEVS